MAVEVFPNGVELRAVSGPDGDHEDHWDPKASGNPLLDTSATEVSLSANFTVGELTTSGGNQFPVARIDPEFVACLQALRDFVGKSVRVTSGYRSWAYNVKIYENRGDKPTKSRHCSGQAADIRIAGLTGVEIAKAAIDACGVNIAVGIGKKSAHIDIRGKGLQWTYLKGKANKKAKTEVKDYRKFRKNNPLAAHAAEEPKVVVDDSSDDETFSIDVARAVERNQVHADRLGWASSRAEIGRIVGIDPAKSAEGEFAEAVAVWQSEQGLKVDGIIGKNTWSRLEEVISDTGEGSP